MKYRILSAMLALAMFVCIFAGCENGGSNAVVESPSAIASESVPTQEQTEAPTQTTVDQTEPPDAEEPPPTQPVSVTYPVANAERPITLWTSIQNNIQQLMETWNDLYCLPNAEEATGIKLEITTVNFESQNEKFNLMVVSEDWPDCVQAGQLYNGGLSQALADEFVMGLSDEILVNNAPDYYEKLTACGDAAMNSAKYGDVYPGVYTIQDDYYEGRGMMVRQDWLDELNMGIPTTREQFTDVLYAIKSEYDPDYTFWMQDFGAMVYVGAAFNTNTTGYTATTLPVYIIDGKVLCAWGTDEYREYVEWFAQLYNDGIFDMEFYNNFSFSPATRYGNLVEGNIGIYEDSFSSINDWKRYADDENAITVSAIPDLLDDNGKNTWGDQRNLISACYSITTSCEIPELVLQYWNYFYTDDGVILANYGVEGESFTYENSEIKYADSVLNNQYNLSYRAALGVSTMNYLVPYYSIESKLFSAYGENAMEAMEAYNPDYQTAEHYYPSGAALTSDESASISTKVADICTYVQENLLKYLTNKDLITDENWNAFQTQLAELGLNDCLAVYQNAYDGYLLGER